VRILLDTHCFLWMQASPGKLSPAVLAMVQDVDNELLLSAASSWEIAVKFALGKLPLPMPPHEYVPTRMASSGTLGLPVEHVHALQVSRLPLHHRDPFDRLLVAQAMVEGLPILSADPQLAAYDVEILNAR
jgi:PIN domain nuclease of toxin-antitoxin system